MNVPFKVFLFIIAYLTLTRDLKKLKHFVFRVRLFVFFFRVRLFGSNVTMQFQSNFKKERPNALCAKI